MSHRLVVGAVLCLLAVFPAASQAQTVAFLDQGAPAAALLDGSTVGVRVADPAANTSPGRDGVLVTVTSDLAGDSESLPLLETGPGTGVFEGVIELEPGGSLAAPTLATFTSPGPPPARDTLHASYGSATATAGLVGSTIRFIDEWGHESASFAAGGGVGLRVRDELRNFPRGRDYLLVSVVSQSSADSEWITLQETGVNTGVFEGTFGTSRSPGSSGDGLLGVSVPDTVTATLNAEDGVTSASAQAQMAGSRVVLRDADGNPADTFVEGALIRIRVIDPAMPGSVSVQVTSTLTGDSETVVLSGGVVYDGLIPTVLVAGTPPPMVPGDGTLQIAEVWGPPMLLDSITVTYSGGGSPVAASAGFIPGRLAFLDSRGEATSSYAAGTEARIRLEYANYNSPSLDRATVRLVNDTTGEEEYVQLTETRFDSGVFIGSIPLSVNGGSQWFNNVLNAQPGEQIRANHGDVEQPTAEITDVSLEFLDEWGEPTDEIVETGPARVRLRSVVLNVSPTSVGSGPVEMRVRLTGDLEPLTVTETGPDTGIFEGSIPTEMSSYAQSDGKLQTVNSGVPDYRQDEVMARSGPVEVTARTVGARIDFLDAFGRKAARYAAGDTVRIRIVDYYQTYYFVNSFPLSIGSLRVGDSKTVTMQRVGQTAVYEGSIATTTPYGGGNPGGKLLVDLTDQIEVRHVTGFSPIEITKRAPVTSSSVLFIDAAGQPAEVYLESTRAYVRVVSASTNSDPTTAGTLTVSLLAELSQDDETLTLTETGPDTGVYEGSIPLRLSFGPPSPGNGTLETTEVGGQSDPHHFDTLRATFNGAPGEPAVARIGLTGSRTWFGNAAGDEVLSFPAGGTAYIWVEDQNENRPGLWDRAYVELRSYPSGDQEYAELLETTRDSGIFRGSIPLVTDTPGSANGPLYATPGDQIEASHQDAFGATASSAVADISGHSLEFIDEAGQPTTEILEGGEARVRMFSVFQNTSPSAADTVAIEIRGEQSGDLEPLMLTETGADTSVFEGSIPMAVGGVSSGNGTLETLPGGAPDYQNDQVTARYGPDSVTVTVAGARIVFLDAYGRVASSFTAGEPVGVRVVDHNRNTPQARDTANVQLLSRDGGDSEPLVLQETGYDTAVFEGSLPSVFPASGGGSGGPGDGQLRVFPADRAEAHYSTVIRPEPIVAVAAVTGNSILFIDAAGQPATSYLESSRAYLRVVSSFANSNPGSAETAVVQLAAELSADQEMLTLTETGPNTGVFEGSIQMRLVLGSGQPGNGILETTELGHPVNQPPHEVDTLRATFSDATGTSVARIGLTGSRTWFADASGQEVLSYAAGGRVYIRVEDQNGNRPDQWDQAYLELFSLQSGDHEYLVLQETRRDSGIFAGSIELALDSPTTANGKLYASPGEQIEATHLDYFGSTSSSAVADVEGGSLSFVDESGEPTAELLEGGDARVRLFSVYVNTSQGQADTVSIVVRSQLSGDEESVTLTETGPNTSVFEGSFPVTAGPGYPGDGTVGTVNSGFPEYLADQVTARYGPAEASARVKGARMTFIDGYGREASSFAAGAPVRVRVVDHNRNTPEARETVNVQLVALEGVSLDVVDSEPLALQETGFDTGVFEGTLPSVFSGSGSPSNGQLQVYPEYVIEARYSMAFDPNPLIAQASVTGNAVLFIDAAGQPATVYLESSRAYLRVVSSYANTNPGSVDTAVVQLAAELSADQEMLTLTETGPGTGVFEGSIQMRLVLGSGQQGNGILETTELGHPVNQPPHEVDRLRATYSDAAGTSVARIGLTGSRTWFADASGQEVLAYAVGGTAWIRVEDHNGVQPGIEDSAYVLVRSLTTGDQEYMTLVETTTDSGIFAGSLLLSATAPTQSTDGQLRVQPGEQIEAVHQDYYGATASSAIADVTEAAIEFINEAGQATGEILERGAARVRVLSLSGNGNPSAADTVTIQMASRYSGDTESVTLTETGASTGLFEGSIPMQRGSGSVVDGVLLTRDSGYPEYRPDEVTASMGPVAATATVLPARLAFLNLRGQEVSTYAQGSTVGLRVADHNQNVDSGQVDTLPIAVRSLATGDSETLTLTETGLDTGRFEGSIPTTGAPPAAIGDGVLFAPPGTVEAEHMPAFSPQPILRQATILSTQAPVAADDTATTGEDTAVAIPVLANDTGAGNLTVAAVTQPANGAAAINPDGTVTYTPAAGFSGTDAFTYLIVDAQGGEDEGEVAVTVTPGNQAPTPAYDNATTPEDQPVTVNVLANDTDPDQDLLDVVAVSQPATGGGTAVLNADDTVTYTPPPNATPVAYVNYTVRDPDGAEATSTLRIEVTAVNDPPVANDDIASTAEDTVVVIEVGANDSDIDSATYFPVSVTMPANGTAEIVLGNVVYTPNPNFSGTDSFSYTLQDDAGATGTATVTVTVTGENDAPVAEDDTATVAEDAEVSIAVLGNDTDAENDPLDVTAVSQGTQGSVVLNPDDTVTYTPNANFSGTDSFTYTVTDGSGTDTATVTVTVTAGNDAPVANDDAATVAEDGSAAIAVLDNDTDPEDDTLQVDSVTQGAHGTVVINPNRTVTYAPAANYNGTDSFTYTASDGNGGTATATVTVTVGSDNDAPVAQPDSATTAEDTAVTVTALGNDSDPDDDALDVLSVTQGTQGTVVLNADDTITYTPALNFHGTDTFTYTVGDGNGGSATATVTVTVTPVNDAPVANADAALVTEDGTVSVTVLANDADADGDALTVASVTQGANGSVVINPDQTVTYTPAANYNGGDSFTCTISDGNGGTATAAVTVSITPANDGPAANPDAATVAEDGMVSITVLANDTDPENDALDVTAVTQGANGSVTLNANDTVTYAPNANFNGTDSFTYTVSDGNGGTATASVTVTVTPVNDNPVATADAASVVEDSSVIVAVLGNDSDLDNDTLHVTAVTQGAHGTVAINANDTITYTPSANYSGSDSFTYTISDGNGGTATATVTTTVTPVNDAPVANADAATVAEDGSVAVTVLGNDSDADGDTLNVTSVTQGAQGSVTINPNKTVTYAPAANYNGSDAFTYTINDGNGGTATATVTVTITAVNDAPVAVNDTAATLAETLVDVPVLSNDTDVDGQTLSVQSVTQPANGTVSINANQTLRYTPAAGYKGPDTFTYVARDGAGGTATATVNLTVNAPPRVATNLQVLYGFNEGSGTTVTDTSGVGTPLNLTIGSAAAVTWISGGLQVNSATLIQSAAAATKVISASQSTNQITLEAWITPVNTSQTAPIATLSQQSNKLNAMLGQAGNRWTGKLRTSSTSQAGTALNAATGSATLNLTHVVYTRDAAGNVRIYVNGVQSASSTLAGNFSSWTNTYKLGLVNELSSGTPWRGTLYLVAIFNRALSSTEARQNWLAGQ